MGNQPQQTASRAGSLALVGGMPALDFCNTSSGRGTDGHIEHLHTASDVLTWACHAAILDAPTGARLRVLCAADPALAKRLLARALDLRDAVHALVSALAQSRDAEQTAIDRIARAHAASLAKGRLIAQNGAFGWTWSVEAAPEETILGPLAASAMAIMTAVDHARLKRCEGHNCGWLFLDATKSANRRWCEMEPCGNRAKQKRRRGKLRADD